MRMLGTVVGGILVAAAFPVATEAAEPYDSVSVQQYGHLAADGLVTLSGTYRCINDSGSGPVFVATTLKQNSASHSIGGSTAVCDGQEHPWTNTGKVDTRSTEGAVYAAGAAQVEARLMSLRTAGGWLPLPHFLAGQESPVTLVGP
ncbi:DUF6299 family protein [Streptomyces sp. A3M-1-3]|uniref:DUF6299 family protein n=1 Tax=Streptomyces sp. A3M-1-3 TaxID=2962044 RepID=UPI0020B69CAB|nr:DUF6299 family protein [Streptomyces sp. A3M-1-3]MCP3820370.1 DUF6299 family protein [Streptomyces sp. A3M-1-3]